MWSLDTQKKSKKRKIYRFLCLLFLLHTPMHTTTAISSTQVVKLIFKKKHTEEIYIKCETSQVSSFVFHIFSLPLAAFVLSFILRHSISSRWIACWKWALWKIIVATQFPRHNEEPHTSSRSRLDCAGRSTPCNVETKESRFYFFGDYQHTKHQTEPYFGGLLWFRMNLKLLSSSVLLAPKK